MRNFNFVSESVGVKDFDQLPENPEKIFVFFHEDTMEDLWNRVGLTDAPEQEIPEGLSEFVVGDVQINILNIVGEGLLSYPDNEHATWDSNPNHNYIKDFLNKNF